MWIIYDIHRDLYWNEQCHCWSRLSEASRYSVEERNRATLPSLSIQWRYVHDTKSASPFAGQPAPRAAYQS